MRGQGKTTAEAIADLRKAVFELLKPVETLAEKVLQFLQKKL